MNNFEVPKNSSNNKPYNTKVIVTNKEKADRKLTIKKEFDPTRTTSGAKASNRSSRALPNKFELKIVGVGYDGSTEVYNQTKEIAIDETLTLENLPYGTCTVTETDGATYNVAYKNDANENNNSVKVSIDKKECSMTLTNHPEQDDDKVNVEATKKWVNGPASDHTVPTFDLYADGVKKQGVTPTITPSGTANKFTYKWSNLQKYNTAGEEIKYTVKEAGMTSNNKFVVNGHTYAVTQQDNEITNIYEIPKTDYRATKKWSGDTSVTRPTMTFTLWRKASFVDEAVPGAEVKEVDGTRTTAKWTGLDKTTAAGAEYSFYVKEAFKTASPENDNWTLGAFDAATNSITLF